MDGSNKLVWFPDPKHGYAIGRIVDIGEANVTVQPVAVASQTGVGHEMLSNSNSNDQLAASTSLEFPYKAVYPCDPLDMNSLISQQQPVDVDDNCALIHLNEAALLENVRIRFQRDKIYTYVAHILIAVNPYTEVRGLHSPEAILRYQGKSLGTLEPHVYAIADKAYRDMKAFKQSQSIIINGESGAGKTESQKYVLRYLCLSGAQTATGRLEKLILDANPLLEAFGNAKTIRNNNSSRFGKFIEIHYSKRFTVSGGLFFHYLLEKSRICTQSMGERNYHIFYQLCACLPAAQWQELQLAAPDKFRYLAGGCTQYFSRSRERDFKLANDRKSAAHLEKGAIQDQLIDELKCFEETERALANFGVSEEEKRAIYSVVAAVLHLGNISFIDSDSDVDNNNSATDGRHSTSSSAASGGCRIATGGDSERALETTAKLMGLDADLLRQSLVSRIMSTTRGGHKGTVYMVQLSIQQAAAARDALAKAIYSKLFDHIVSKIVNKSIPALDEQSASYYIGVLDVAGFEYFQHNSFEQFLINFCNERLQQFFNERILKEEQSIYEKEGLALKHVDFVDNQDCIQLFESKATGVFDLLDEESRLPKPSAQHFTQAVHAANRSHFRLAVPRSSKLRAHREIRDDEGFLIRHFAGAVCYETQSFIDKNNDALHASLKNLMLEANQSLLRTLFSSAVGAATGVNKDTALFSSQQPVPLASNKLNFVSVATTFRSQLADLMGKLRSTGSHFIRCIKPNSEMVAHKFEGGQIMSQLHCSGMNSVLELMQQGFPSRSSFNDLYAAYKRLLPVELVRLDAHLFCRALFKALGLSDADFRFGSSKVFFRPGKFAEFDQIIRTEDSAHVAELVRRVSRWLTCSRWRKAQYSALCVIKLNQKILYRRQLIIRLQRHWRQVLIQSKLRFRLQAVRTCRAIEESLREFQLISGQQMRNNKLTSSAGEVEEQTQLLKAEVASFVTQMSNQIQQIISNQMTTTISNNNNNDTSHTKQSNQLAKSECQAKLDKLTTKRDLLIRSIKDKIAKQVQLAELERKMAEETKRRMEEELAKVREAEIKQQRTELELRRQLELQKSNSIEQQPPIADENKQSTGKKSSNKQLVDSATDPISQYEEQEQRDYEIALRLAQDTTATNSSAVSQSELSLRRAAHNHRLHQPLPPSATGGEQLAATGAQNRYDLTKWKYSDLRDTINTSCDLELLEACKREFHRRLKVYHAWRALNSRQAHSGTGAPGGAEGMRAPSSIMSAAAAQDSDSLEQLQKAAAAPNEQRYFRIPFVKSATAPGRRGWWFAHFDGQWIARQLELHPDKEPILLVAGKHDIEMCELSLRETRLTSKRGAEILPQEFEEEWTKHGGCAYEQQRRR